MLEKLPTVQSWAIFAPTTIVEKSPIIVSLEIDTHGEITLPFPILADGLIIVSDETLENNDINFEELKTNERIKKKRIIKDTKNKRVKSLNKKPKVRSEKSKLNKSKNEPVSKITSLKEIKNKKTGWWQKWFLKKFFYLSFIQYFF